MNKKNAAQPDKTGKIDYSQFILTKKLSDNIEVISKIFENDKTVVFRNFESYENNSIKCCAVYIDGMINNRIINDDIIFPIQNTKLNKEKNLVDEIELQVVQSNQSKKAESIEELVEGLLYGDTVLFFEGYKEALIVNSKGWATRGVTEPDDEKSLRGPREGFTESMLTNISMIRRKIQTSDLKFSMKNFGSRTNTKACICYLDSLVDKKVLAELENRLKKINIDGVFSTNYIEEFIKDSPFSMFKTLGSTEKPDIAAAKLLEGRIALILDGTPIVLTLPYLFVENFQSTDDYYINFYYGSFGRILRFIGFFITISLPAIYVALLDYHPEMIPDTLLVSISNATKGVPFPTVVECFIMMIMFEILRETGIRLPSKIGQALSIVGALVIGQAAVEAKIVSPPMVIVIATTGITGLMIPRLSGAIITMRLISLISASFLGIYGYIFCIIGLCIQIFSMKSFGTVYISQFLSYHPQSLKDIYVRVPFPFIKRRPEALSSNRIRGGRR